ncbi:hypothetical protein BKA82DRAFT_4009830 [Pisolithus tinctorius]|nr:hypothetical protein BKA82DRAFT_4009830 [Pisolithus tinctorius]
MFGVEVERLVVSVYHHKKIGRAKTIHDMALVFKEDNNSLVFDNDALLDDVVKVVITCGKEEVCDDSDDGVTNMILGGFRRGMCECMQTAPLREDFMDLDDWIKLTEALPYTKAVIDKSLRFRLHSLVTGKFRCSETLYRSIATHNVIIGGSVALRLMFGERCEEWSPRTLDVFVGCNEWNAFGADVTEAGFWQIAVEDRSCCPSTSTRIQCIQYFRNTHALLTVVVARTPCAITPIFEAWHTITMNFITSANLFCAYPYHTLRRTALINPRYVIDVDRPNEMASIQIEKYRLRGISTEDSSAFAEERQHGVKRVSWKLGGKSCGNSRRIVVSYVHEIFVGRWFSSSIAERRD